MSNTDFREHRALVREIMEKECGQQPIGSLGPCGSSSCYIGIHEDERDGLFKQWFTASQSPLTFTNSHLPDNQSSLLLNFDGAVHLLESMSAMTSAHPALELPSSEQVDFIRMRLPNLLTIYNSLSVNDIHCCNNQQQGNAPDPQNNVVYLFDEEEKPVITRDEPYAGEIGLVLPVYSMPVPQLGLGKAA